MVRLSRNKQSPREEAESRFRAALQGHGLRWTGEREAILEAVLARQGHFVIDDLVADLRHKGVAASRATVYRALPRLVEAGLLVPRGGPGEDRRYELAFGRAHHDHLVCQRCGRVVEFHFEAFEMLQVALAAKYGFELVGHVHELYGVCQACRKAGEQ